METRKTIDLEPFAAVSNPPAGKHDRDGCAHSPPEGQDQVSDKPKNGKTRPEDLPLHVIILSLGSFGERTARIICANLSPSHRAESENAKSAEFEVLPSRKLLASAHLP